jgi:hypothetical protein
MNILMGNRSREADDLPGAPSGEKIIGAVGGGMISKIVVNTIRKLLNDSISSVTPDQIIEAVQGNTSIWSVGQGNIIQIAKKVPPAYIRAGKPMYQKACDEYGSPTGLVMAWLKEDNMPLYSMIINTPGGVAWFDRQVHEMTTNLGLE